MIDFKEPDEVHEDVFHGNVRYSLRRVSIQVMISGYVRIRPIKFKDLEKLTNSS